MLCWHTALWVAICQRKACVGKPCSILQQSRARKPRTSRGGASARGAPGTAPSRGRHRAGLHAPLQLWTNEVLLATAWPPTRPAGEDWESWGLEGDCLESKSAGQQEVLWRIAQKDIVLYFLNSALRVLKFLWDQPKCWTALVGFLYGADNPH